MRYRPRIIDQELRARLRRSGAVLVEGPKACGKTESARRIAASEVRLDTDPDVARMMEIDPYLLLAGETPRLLDEWQHYPELWNYVRREIDDRKQKSLFLLTGSSNPEETVKKHSGALRISRMRMRPMSWYELGFSTGEVSLKSLLDGDTPLSAPSASTLDEIIEQIVRGGWPSLLEETTADARAEIRDYIDLLADVDLSKVSDTRRDPTKVRQLLRSLARNVATEATLETLAADITQENDPLNRETVSTYLEALMRLMVVEDQPAWRPHLRSSAPFRKSPKRHFVDPSLAVAALGADQKALLDDLNYFGFLFESEVIRDLRVYAQAVDATVSHFRDASGLEIDAILQLSDNSWAAFEIKLGMSGADQGAASLLALRDKVNMTKTGELRALTVITSFGFAHQRKDGVNVVPLTTLKN